VTRGASMPQQQEHARLVARAADIEAIRSVRRLQHQWGHLAEVGDVTAMGALFADDARLVLPPHDVTGRTEIDRLIAQQFGAASGGFDLRLMLSPVITVAADGRSARGRWHELALSVRAGQDGVWSGGIHENVYVKRGDGWLIAEMHLFPQFSGTHLEEWRNLAADTAEVPFHFSPTQAGTPIPARLTDPSDSDASRHLNEWADALVDEGLVRNLVNAYAFYMDRKSWDDVADLFAPDATLVRDDQSARGRDAIRSLLEQIGPQGLRDGELFDHLQTMPIVTFGDGGDSASVRTIELTIVASHGDRAVWSYAVCEIEVDRVDGRWMISTMRIAERAHADHARGWAGEGSEVLPGRPAGGSGEGLAVALGPATGSEPGGDDGSLDLVAAATSLDRALAFDAAENLSCAYGYFLDEARWPETAELFARDGWKELSFIGTYIGRDRIRDSLIGRYGTTPRKPDFLPIHQKLQPYVTVSADGRSAQVRLKMLQVNSGWDRPASIVTGVYENQAVLEDGVWRLHGMDLEYLTLTSWADGWVDTPPDAAQMFAPDPEAIAAFSPAPDAPLRGERFAPYPLVAPLGFHFCNPVSGRSPALLLDWSDGRFDLRPAR